ncbi:hypothetical protein G5B39_16115 (plasmid) [Rhodobacteraceae bacterium SC52]|nr:hypothetical protein G5B39_16115 [Rhodobacteraceae bacterium SC52]
MKFFEDSNALESLRHSDFDALSAYGEVIDNSIQANAKKIAIQMQCLPRRHNREQIETLAFGDDGDGMDETTVHSCLKLGWSSRFNDRSGIGRFGVGMVLGAIHEVRKVEVYSKQRGSSWLYTYIDLDEIENDELDEIPPPKKVELPDNLKGLTGTDSGTVVVWSNYDKQVDSGDIILRNAEHWIGRTFRYYIWDGLEITLNGTVVCAHDPLRVRTEKTKYPNDTKAEKFDPILLKWRVPQDSAHAQLREQSEVVINTSLLPEDLRPNQGAGSSNEIKQRHIEQGISILRNKREVFFGTIPYWSSVEGASWNWEEIDRWWGCEILFDAELDSEFSVKNIKRGALPQRDLKIAIKRLITPTRESALEEVRRVWAEAAAAKKQNAAKENAAKGRGPHSVAEDIAGKTATPKSKFDAKKTQKDAAAEISEQILTNQTEDERAKTLALFNAQPFTITESTWGGSTFWEIYHAGGSSLITYNKRHEFFQKIDELMDALANEDPNPVGIAEELKTLIDLLLISSAKAQSLNDSDAKVNHVGDFLEQHNNQWGMMLTNYLRQWGREKNE